MLVNLSGLSVFLEQATEDAHAAHPEDRNGHSGIGGTLALSSSRVAPKTLGGGKGTDTEAGGRSLRLANDESILDQLANVLS